MSREYPNRPIVGIGAVVIRDGKILLARRGNPPLPGAWSLPGGAQKVGESVFDAARREVAEETGLEIEVLGVVDVVDSIHRDADGRVQYHYTLIDVFAQAAAGTAEASDDAAEVGWFSLEDLGALNLWTETERIIRLGHEMWTVLRDGPVPR